MWRNNIISLVAYVVVGVATYIVYLIPNYFFRYNQHSKWQLLIMIPLFLMVMTSFLFTGRYILKAKTSLVKNTCSVLLPAVIGILCTVNIAHSPAADTSFLGMYFAYSTPFLVSLGVVDTNLRPGVAFLAISSIMPSIFYLVAMQWQAKVNRYHTSIKTGRGLMKRRWGIVKWFKEDKGYGRIMLEGRDGDHVFVIFSEIEPDVTRFPKKGPRSLKQGQKVSFELIENPKIQDSQRKSAKNVRIIENGISDS